MTWIYIIGLGVLLTMLMIHLVKKYKLNQYYASNEFRQLVDSNRYFIDKCNEFNNYVTDLKYAVLPSNKKTGNYTSENRLNTGMSNYNRGNLDVSNTESNTVHKCSLAVLGNARKQPFKYICKYFSISENEESLAEYEALLGKLLSIRDGMKILEYQRSKLNEIMQVPQYVLKWDKQGFYNKIGFHPTINKIVYPRYTFSYLSDGGRSGQDFSVVFDVKTTEDFIKYLNDRINYKKTSRAQRNLMTVALREEIKKRDNYTCKKCGISLRDEPHLLLEVDHIIPIAKGGITEISNLQTLCWQCNRSKSSKIQ